MRTLTQKEVQDAGGNCYGSSYALYDNSKRSFFLTSDKVEHCEDALKRMTPQHPKFNDMEIVALPTVTAK